MKRPFDLDPTHLHLREILASRYDLVFPRRPRVRILIVVEPGIEYSASGGFGVGRVIDLLINETLSWVNFTVHIAERGVAGAALDVNTSASAHDARFTGMRFDSKVDGVPVIDGYDEIWCFGKFPFVHDNGTDQDIVNSPYNTDPAEMKALSDWMDKGGGLLAMGDHNMLGATMCWKIPRAGTMRAWTKSQGVPNRTGTTRHDTNRPMNDDQDPNHKDPPDQIPSLAAEMDKVPQPLEWKRYRVRSYWSSGKVYRPHPLLCGGELGVINVLPDHPHEGYVIPEADIDLAAKCWHDGSTDEYPSVDGYQPKPQVIAWVNTLGDPPYDHQKGEQPARRFPAIGVYDGDAIGRGRVVVDSTWHHWFNMNLDGLESGNPTAFAKISRYFLNTAVWLARSSQRSAMLTYATFWAANSIYAVEELSPGLSKLAAGRWAIDVIGRRTSHCLVEDWIRIQTPWLPALQEELFVPGFPTPCWTCPPEDLFFEAVIGGMVMEMLPLRERIREQGPAKGKKATGVTPEDVEAAAARGAAEGLKEAFALVASNEERLSKAVAVLGHRIAGPSKPGKSKR